MTNTKGMTMPQIDDAELFGNAEDQRAYEDFCANQEAVEKFTLDKPALVCRWRMSNKKVPMLNRHIRALSERLVQGEPLTHNMLSWAKQHVEWSLAEGDYTAHDGVLMLVIDINGNAGGRVPVRHGDAHRAARPDQGHPGHARRHSRATQGRAVPGERRARRGSLNRDGRCGGRRRHGRLLRRRLRKAPCPPLLTSRRGGLTEASERVRLRRRATAVPSPGRICSSVR